MATQLRNSGPKPASGPPRPMSPVKEDDLKDYFTLVELLWKMSPRELKKAMVIRDGNILLEVIDDKTPEAKKIVDLVRLCRNIPGHLITCLIKEDPKFWVNDYLLHGIKLLFHLIRLGKKCHGDLEKQINRKVDLILDVCVFMLVVSLQTMSNTTDLRTGESCVNIIGTCYLMVDYVIDLEFDSKRQPFLDALIDHPKLETFITATFDAARLITKHCGTFSNKGESYSALVTKCLSSIFDCMDTLCMAEEFVEKILDKTRWGDGAILDALTDVLKDYKFGTPVINSCLKLIYRFCEEEQPPFLNTIATGPSNGKFQQLISTVVELTSDCLSNKLKGNEDLKLESIKLLEILSDDQNYKQDIISKGTNLILKFLSRAPQQFADQFSNADRNAIIILFKTVGNLHCRANKDDQKNKFLNQVVDVAKHRGLFLKKFTTEERIYIPFAVQNLNFVIDSTLKNSNLHKEISKEDVELVFDFRKELERTIGLNLSPNDAEFEKKLLDWDSSHSSEVEDDSSRESKSKIPKAGTSTVTASTSSATNTKKRKREEEEEDDEDSGGKRSKKRRKKEEEDYEEAGTDDDKKPGRVGRPPKKKRGRKAGSVNRQRHTSIQKPSSGGCFEGLTFRLGKSVDRPDLIEKIVENGGVVLQYTTKHTTHYLATKDEYDEKGPQIMAAIKRPIFIVSEQFVHDSVKGNKKVAEIAFFLDASKSAPAIKTNGEGIGAVKRIE